MQLRMGDIGSTPPAGGEPAVVGLPIWLWVANPAPNTTGPITASAGRDGVTVTVTATLDRIEYTMEGADGRLNAQTVCSGGAAPGTPYEPSFGGAPSPTCGFTQADNQKTGSFVITGTAYWVAEWSGGGQQGTIPVTVSNSVAMEVGEVQVVQVNPG